MQSFFCENRDLSCLNRTIWDRLYITDYDEEKQTQFQRSRLGFILIHLGIWIHWRSAQLMVPQISEKEKTGKAESFDKNCWYKGNWMRWNFICLSIILIIFEIYFVHFSFTEVFATNIYLFIVVFKIIGVIVENIAEVLLNDKLMLSPLSSTIGAMENLCTFGAENFLDFIVSFVVGLGMLMLERPYVMPAVDLLVGWIIESIEKVKNFLTKYFFYKKNFW